MRKLSLRYSFLILAACGGSKTPATVNSTTLIAAGSQCAAGGISVQSGPDKNGNGKLDAAESTTTQVICQTVQYKLASSATPFAAGLNNCALGGTQTAFGLDNGDAGGVAGDGILQPGEVQTTVTSCNTAPDIAASGSVTPPADQPGQSHFTIDTHGGSTAADGVGGGIGGPIKVSIQGIMNQVGGDVKVFATGLADASCSAPTTAAFNGGSAAWTLTASTTVHHTAGEGYFLDGEAHIIHRVSSVDTVVTGIEVPKDITLTFDATSEADVALAADFHLVGTLNASATTTKISLTAASYVSEASSKIDLSGTARVGGELDLFATNVVLHGEITSNGGTGSPGFEGGTFSVQARDLFSDATVSVIGGPSSAASAGGNGGGVQWHAYGATLCHAGVVTTSSGAGVGTSHAGSIQMQANEGSLINRGTLTATGASAGACASCDGGAGGPITLQAYGAVTTNGALSAFGGDASADKAGGAGVTIQISAASRGLSGKPSIQMSGQIDTHGGRGKTGGVGGEVNVATASDLSGALGDVLLLGYTKLVTNGGSGGTAVQVGQFGAGGAIQLFQSNSQLSDPWPTGAVINYAALDTHGGDYPGGVLGAGGNVTLQTPTQASGAVLGEFVFNAGSINANTGNGGTAMYAALSTVRPGEVLLLGFSGVQNQGAITSSGGLSQSSSANGGQVSLLSKGGAVTNTQSLSVKGGSTAVASYSGGFGGNIGLGAEHVQSSGVLDASGGSASSLADFAGHGGVIQLFSSNGASEQTGAVNLSAGTGEDQGLQLGTIIFDAYDPRFD